MAAVAKKCYYSNTSKIILFDFYSSFEQPKTDSSRESSESREERRARKRKSRWGGNDGIEKTFIPGMPTMMPQGLSKEQEEAYLRKSLYKILRRIKICDQKACLIIY